MPDSVSMPDQPQEQAVEKPPQRAERCENCRFWEQIYDHEPDSKEAFGVCHRGLIGANQESSHVWPGRFSLDWCGEFQAKGVAPVSRPASQIGWCEFFGGIKMHPNAKGRMISALREGDDPQIKSIADLILLTAEDLHERREFGAKSFAAVRVRLAEFGLKLKGD